jgi:hypothetical protein
MDFFNSIQKKVPTNPEDCNGIGSNLLYDCSKRAMVAHNVNKKARDDFSDTIDGIQNKLAKNDKKMTNFEPADNETLCKNETYMNDISIKCGFFDNKCNENEKIKKKYEKCLQDKNNETQLKMLLTKRMKL